VPLKRSKHNISRITENKNSCFYTQKASACPQAPYFTPSPILEILNTPLPICGLWTTLCGGNRNLPPLARWSSDGVIPISLMSARMKGMMTSLDEEFQCCRPADVTNYTSSAMTSRNNDRKSRTRGAAAVTFYLVVARIRRFSDPLSIIG